MKMDAPLDIPGIHTLPLIALGIIPRPTVSNTLGPSDIVSAAHSVINENWEQIPTKAKYHNPKDARYHEDVIPELYFHIGAAMLRE